MGILEDSRVSQNATADERFNVWLTQKAPATQVNYRAFVKELTDFFERDLQGLVDFHKKDILTGDGQALRRAFLNYLVHAQTIERTKRDESYRKPLSRKSAEYRLKPLNIVLELYNLPKIKIVHSVSHPKAKRAITLEQIKELIGYCGRRLRHKAIIYALKDSGLRIGDLAKLTVEDYLGASRHYDEEGREYRAWKELIITSKKDTTAHVHFGYEAIKILNEYIGQRTTGYIFLQEQHKIGAPMNSGAISRMFYNLTEPLKKKGYNVSAHSFRKTFMTATIPKGLIEPMAKMIVGKQVDRSDVAYYQWESELTNTYMRVYPEALAIDNEERDNRETTNKMNRMEEELKGFKELMTPDMLEYLKKIKSDSDWAGWSKDEDEHEKRKEKDILI